MCTVLSVSPTRATPDKACTAHCLPEGMAHLSHRTPGGVYHAPAPTRRYVRPRQNGRRGRCARRLPVGTFYMYGAVSVAPRARGEAVEHGTAPRPQRGPPVGKAYQGFL